MIRSLVTLAVLLIIFFSAFSMAGCAIKTLPSLEYCDKVEYIREGDKVSLSAECRAPRGSILG